MPKTLKFGGNDDTEFEDIHIGDKSISGGKCTAKILVVVTDEEFDHRCIKVIAATDKEHYDIDEFEKLWDEAKKNISIF